MIPILFNANATDFSTYGIGTLTDTLSCQVTEERNGAYECVLTYPVTGRLYAEIQKERLIKAKPNDISAHQMFRIYRITKPLNGIVKIYAQHLSYDLTTIAAPIWSSTEILPQLAINAVFDNALTPHNFTFKTDYQTQKPFAVTKPKSLRAVLGGEEGSVIDLWGGEFEWDNYNVIHHQGRGTNTGVVIEYGKNLTSLEEDSDISGLYTELLPYAVTTDANENEVVITLSEQTLPIAKSELSHAKTLIKDFSDSFDGDEEMTEEALRAKAQTYLENNPLGVENPTIKVSFEPLWKQPEYSALLERVSLCDRVTIKHTILGVTATAKVVTTVYDTLAEKYVSITLGSAKSTLLNTISETKNAIESATVKVDRLPTLMSHAIEKASNLITGQSGGYVVLHGDENGYPYELLVMDAPSIDNAVNIWRWNVAGLGFSKKGYNGPYETAITADGAIVADFITSGTLVANIIKAGILSSKDGSSYWNLDTGEIVIKAYATTDSVNEAIDTVEDRAAAIESSVSSLAQTATSIEARVTQNETNISSLTVSAGQIATRISTVEGNMSTVTQTVNGLATRVASAEGDISALEQTTTSLSASVSSKLSSSGGATSSFGWSLTSSGFYLYSNSKTVMSVTSSGLSVSGSITATSGTIGGFTIGSSALYKTKTAYNDSNAGVYIGTDGIGLGAGAFYVTSAGSIYATSGKIGGMSLTASQMYSQNFILGTVYNADDASQSFTTLSFGTTSGSTFTATTVLTNSGCYMQTLSSNAIACGIIRVQSIRADSSISTNTGFYFGYSGGSVQYYAELSWSGQMLYLKVYNEDGVQSPLAEAKSFTVHYACIWGKDTTWNATVAKGASSTSLDTNAFWGIDYATFNYSSSNKSQHTYYFTISGTSASTTITSYGHIVPWFDNTYDLGSAAYKWRNIYGQAGVVNTSDRNEKFNVLPLADVYSRIFDRLIPITFKFVENTSDRTHIGLVAQDVKDAVLAEGLTTKEFAGYCEWENEDKSIGCGLRYSEFVAMNIYEIQKLKARVKELEEKLLKTEETTNET